ncbi:ribonuclease III [Candidatus Nitrotoga fabula]|uniref:Ribonuclease 3 n=1 Tax=Candidatus Nitrotoga fabula TaxID=2182327 RepID=A0A2X0RCK3_9PROT|nr:ribonuclease III [Candidatus Nitrotoga fabula]CAE6722072.1 RNase III [Candidatus Nitrotoga fabula]SPS05354.1 RNase III [Candidatus Nitrotoga fabula]
MNRDVLCDQIGHVFAQSQLLQRALTHRSYSSAHNERLEFLGDSVLNCVVAKHLYEIYPGLAEGDLSRLRSNLVNQQTLSKLAQQLRLGELLLLGEGERKSAGFRRPSILADTMEALFGAVFLDAGFAAAEQVILKLYVPFIASADAQTLGKDYKTLLQEYLQGKRLALPRYILVATQGEAHAQLFQVECQIEQLKLFTSGEGSSRRTAEQVAAEAAYRKIEGLP